MKLIQQERKWGRPPEPQKLALGMDAQVVLAGWSNSETTRPWERISDHADSNHVVSLTLGCTTSELCIGRENLRAVSIPAGTTLVAALEGFDFRSTYRSVLRRDPSAIGARHTGKLASE